MKLQEVHNESQRVAEYYLHLASHGEDLSSTDFVVRPNMVIIYQPIDDEEDDKYYVVKHEVSPETWNKIVDLAKDTKRFVRRHSIAHRRKRTVR